MAQVIWTASALNDLDSIASYIGSRNPDAGARLVERVFAHTHQLARHPQSGPVIPEMRRITRLYRQIVEPPCRVFYRIENDSVVILRVIRGEMKFSAERLRTRFRDSKRPTSSEDPR